MLSLSNNRRKHLVVYIGITASGLLFIAVMVFYAKASRYTGGGFQRNIRTDFAFVPYDTIVKGRIDDLYIAGHSKSMVYLASYRAPARLIAIDIGTGDTSHLYLEIEDQMPMLVSSIQVNVDSPYFYLTEGTAPIIYKGTLTERIGRRVGFHKLPYFTDFTPLASNKAFIRALSSERRNILGVINLSSSSVSFSDDILEPQLDGLFCTAGLISRNASGGTIIYVYSYRNEFFTIDSSLCVITHARTIDTTTIAKVRTAMLENNRSTALASPPIIVNRKVSTYNDLIFIQSEMLADKEGRSKQLCAIDMYHLSNGNYAGSFYLPPFAGDYLSEFHVLSKHVIIVIYPTAILRFERDCPDATGQKYLHVNQE